MRTFSLTHLADRTLLQGLVTLVSQDRATTAALLAHLAEVDERKLYLPAAYPSMHHFCVGELRLSEEAAFKRIRVARAARQFPAIFDAIADGQLNLSAVVCLATHLTAENAAELLSAAAHRSRAEIEQMLAERFPRADVPTRVEALQPAAHMLGDGDAQLSPGTVEVVHELAARPVEEPPKPAKVTPLAPQRFAIQLTVGQGTRDKLRRAQELLGHAVPSGDLEAVFDRALDALIQRLEKRKFAAASKPGSSRRRPAAGERFVPADVKRAVWERDGGRYTFVSEAGHRCEARTFLEFDHVDAVARGGRATVDRMRLRCRAHNQFEAERLFGAGFMNEKRDRARKAAAWEKAARNAREDVIPWLRRLGFRVEEARRAAAVCDAMPDATLERRVRAALMRAGPNVGESLLRAVG